MNSLQGKRSFIFTKVFESAGSELGNCIFMARVQYLLISFCHFIEEQIGLFVSVIV